MTKAGKVGIIAGFTIQYTAMSFGRNMQIREKPNKISTTLSVLHF